MSEDHSLDRNLAHGLPLHVNWSEGMLLCPQHFQQEAWRQDAAASYRLTVSHPFPWGVRQLKVDKELLAEGVYHVLELDALMPDGLVVSVSSGSPELKIEIEDIDEDVRQAGFAIHLCVAPHSKHASVADHSEQRFHTDVETKSADENLGEDTEDIVRMRPRLTLKATSGPRVRPGGSISLPLDRLNRTDAEFSIWQNYQRPTMKVVRDAPVWKVGQEVHEAIRGKIDTLYAQPRNTRPADPRFLTIALPKLRVLLKSNAASPFDLHIALSDALGATSAATDEPVPALKHSFHPNDPYPAASELAREIKRLLDRVFENEEVLDFEPNISTGAFHLPTGAVLRAGPLLLEVAPSRDGDRQSLAEWMDQVSIGDEVEIDEIVLSRFKGAVRTAEREKPEMSRRGGNHLRYIVYRGDALPTSATRIAIQHLDGLAAKGQPERVSLVLRNFETDGSS